jgi:hypothetical protein
VSEWGYVVAGWATVTVVLGGYAVSILRRGRRLAAQVDPGYRRWMDAP